MMGALDALTEEQEAEQERLAGTEAAAAAGGDPDPEPEPAALPAQGEQTWLVQRTELIDLEPAYPRVVWVDVGQVSVPPRTKRKTIVGKALETYPGAMPAKDEQGVAFRVLDADSAERIPVGWEVPPAPEPEFRIG